MPLIPLDQLQEAVEDVLTEFRKGVGNFAKNQGEAVRIGEAQFSFEVVLPGTLVRAQEQSNSENAWKTKGVQTEVAGPQEITENTKSGNYTQGGYTIQQQSGGSSEDTEYTYDPTA